VCRILSFHERAIGRRTFSNISGKRKACYFHLSKETFMNLLRRKFFHLIAGAAAVPALSRIAWAQAYPTRPVRIIVPYAPAGPTDIIARLMSQWLSERLGQQFIVENRPGAGGNVGTEAVVRTLADGYTLLMVGSPHAINATLYEKLNFDFLRDITPVANIVRVPLVLELNPSVPVKTVPEFIAYAKANSGRINYASAGNGTPQHVSGELFKMMTGVNMQHVPYRGSSPALTDLISGQVQAMIDTTPASIEFIRAGKLRALAVTTAGRSDALPDLASMSDFVPGYEASSWYGIGVASNTPADIVDKLNKEINAGLADPKLKVRLMDLGGMIAAGSTADFARHISTETEKWARVVKYSGAKPD
jgi:tripartite-type tricarboxylate transporter receptor subunit TctC